MEGLVVQGLRAGYPRGPEVLHGVDFTAPRGAITALLGPNGSGKSTLLRAVLGLVESTGTIRLDGEELGRLTLPERARRIAYVPQRTQLASNMSVRSVVELGRFAHRRLLGAPAAGEREAVDRALEQSETVALADRLFLELSGGEQQRVLLARALATGAKAILLDEPTSSQDVGHALDLHAVLRGLADRDCVVVVVLHDLSEARGNADRAVLLDRGAVHSAGPTDAVISREPLNAVYRVDPIEGGGLGYRRLDAEGGGAPR